MPGFGISPFADAAFGEDGSGAPFTGVLLDLGDSMTAGSGDTETYGDVIPGLRTGIAVSDVIVDRLYGNVIEALTVGCVATPELLANLIDRVNATGTVLHTAKLSGNLTAGVNFNDTVVAAWQLLLSSGLQTAGTAAQNIRRLIGIVDMLAATGAAESQLSAFAAVVAAITMEGLIAQGFEANAVSAVLLSDTAAALAKMLAPLVDGVTVGASAVGALRLSAIAADGMSVGEDPVAALRFAAELQDGLLFYGVLRLGGEDYRGWVMNTTLRAISENSVLPFDSFATFRGKHYGAGPAGIAQFTGRAATDTAGSVAVDAFVRTALDDFGTSRFKRMPDVFLALTTDGQLYMKVLTRDPKSGAALEDWYRVTRTKDGPGTGRVEPGRGLKSTWWQLELHNIDGAGFDLDKLELRPLVLDRRT